MKKYEGYTSYASLWNTSFPNHWNVLPLYALAKEKSICNSENLPLLSVYLDMGVIPFSKKTEKRTNVTSIDLSKYQRVDIGDFVLNNQQAWRGSVGISFYTGIVSPAYIVLSMNNQIYSRYANYLLRSQIMVAQYLLNSKSVGSIQRNLYWTALKRIRVPVPPRDEQEQIVRFLDWKVSAINRLINIKRKEIACLEEMKNTVISHAVTNPKWEIVPLKRCLCSIADIDHYMPLSVDKGYPYVMTGDLRQTSSDIDFDKCKKISQEDFGSIIFLVG